MTDKKYAKPLKMTSPKGKFIYPRLSEPDTKFKEAGEYSVKLCLTSEQAEPMITKLTPLHKAAVKHGKEVYAALKKSVRDKNAFKAAELFSKEYDDEDEETGNLLFNFKMLASGTGKKSGKPWSRRPTLFDVKGQPITDKNISPWGGTIGKVSFEVPMFNDGSGIPGFYTVTAGAGLSLRLCAVQIIDLVQGGERSAEDHGFGEEEGYEAPEKETFDDASDDDDAAKTKGNEEEMF